MQEMRKKVPTTDPKMIVKRLIDSGSPTGVPFVLFEAVELFRKDIPFLIFIIDYV
jgi:hypothetical protein